MYTTRYDHTSVASILAYLSQKGYVANQEQFITLRQRLEAVIVTQINRAKTEIEYEMVLINFVALAVLRRFEAGADYETIIRLDDDTLIVAERALFEQWGRESYTRKHRRSNTTGAYGEHLRS